MPTLRKRRRAVKPFEGMHIIFRPREYQILFNTRMFKSRPNYLALNRRTDRDSYDEVYAWVCEQIRQAMQYKVVPPYWMEVKPTWKQVLDQLCVREATAETDPQIFTRKLNQPKYRFVSIEE